MSVITEERTRIMIVPASSGAGASFIAQLLAVQLAMPQKQPQSKGFRLPPAAALRKPEPQVSLIETAGECFFAALGMEQDYLAQSFEDCSLALEKGLPIRSICNERSGINMLLRVPGKSPGLTVPRLFRLLSSAPGRLQLFDLSGLEQELVCDAAAEGEVRILVIDPLPVKLLQDCRFISSFLLRFPDTVLVVNKMNPGVHKKELTGFLGGKGYLSVPHLPAEQIYKAQYSCQLPAMLKEAQALLLGPGEELLQKIYKLS